MDQEAKKSTQEWSAELREQIKNLEKLRDQLPFPVQKKLLEKVPTEINGEKVVILLYSDCSIVIEFPVKKEIKAKKYFDSLKK